VNRVCVIGSGIFGIAAVREILRTVPGCRLDWVSADTVAGGLWSAPARDGLMYDSLHLNTSRERSAFSGTTIPGRPTVHFVHHARYAEYLAGIAAECAGAERHWGCRVLSVVEQPGGGWSVRWSTGDGGTEERRYAAVVDATGHNAVPRGPDVPIAGDAAYEISHSAEYSSPDLYRGRNLLVVGGGASAVDIACDLVPFAATVGISVRTPAWYLPKMFLGRPIDRSAGGGWRGVPLLGRLTDRVAEQVVRRVVGSYRSYGLADPVRPLAMSAPVLSDHFLAHLGHGRITAYPAVTALEQTSVRFADGAAEKFDAVITATGFTARSGHLPPAVRDVLSTGRLGLDVEAAAAPRLFLMNRFRCADAAVRCAEVQAAAVAAAVRNPRPARTRGSGATGSGTRVTASVLRKAYAGYR